MALPLIPHLGVGRFALRLVDHDPGDFAEGRDGLGGLPGGGACGQRIDVLGDLLARVGGGHAGFGERHGRVRAKPHVPACAVDLEPQNPFPPTVLRDDQV